jgi:Zn-dependent protease
MDNLDLMKILADLGIFFVPFLFALCFHEYAHGLVARWRGDNTALMMGRLTMNPLAHADPLGTFVLPIAAIAFHSPFFFGWAKPVPVNERNLKGKNDMFWVALAGPLSNILLSLIGTVLLAFVYAHFRGGPAGEAYVRLLETFLMINMFLAIFNLIPIHPLDGGKVLAPFLPASWNIWLENNQGTLNMALLILLMLGGRVLAVPVYFASEHLRQLAISLAMAMG